MSLPGRIAEYLFYRAAPKQTINFRPQAPRGAAGSQHLFNPLICHMLELSEYHRISEEMLNSLQEALEEADQAGLLDVERQGDILTLTLASRKQLLVSKHSVSRQLWLSSPISGGLHFRFENNAWTLPDGRSLQAVLAEELRAMAGLSVVFP